MSKDRFTYEILKTTEKGAMLITDGTKVAWVSPRARRKDGFFGLGAFMALEKSYMTIDTYDNPKAIVKVLMYKFDIEDWNEKSYRVFVPALNMYDAMCTERFEFLPKSLVTLEESTFSNVWQVSIPNWLLWQKNLPIVKL